MSGILDLTYYARAYTDDREAGSDFKDRLAAVLSEQRESLILWLPVFLSVGIGVYFSLPFEPSYIFTLSGFICAGIGGLFVVPYKNAGGLRALCFYVVTALFLIIAGFGAAQWRTVRVQTPMLTEALSPVQVEGRIISIESLEEGKGQRLVLDRLVIEGLHSRKTPERIRLSMRQGGKYLSGQRVTVLAGLNPPSPPVMPGAFDFQKYAYFKKLGAFGFTFEVPEIITGNENNVALLIESLRISVAQRIANVIPAGQASFLSALMAGKRSGISELHWEAMRDSGLAHMLAISGLHVGMVSAIVFFMVRGGLALFPSIALQQPIKKYAAVAALLAAFGYMLLVGSTVPTVRAMLMTGIVLFAIMIDRNPFSLRLVALSACAILLFLPEALLGASFQMSFAAVTALIFFYECVRERWSGWYRNAGWFKRVLLYFVGVSMTTLIAGFATGLFSIYHFQQFANYSLLANFLAVPLMAFLVMPLCVLSYALMPFGLEYIPLNLAAYGVGYIISIAEEVARLPHSTYTPPGMGFGVFIMLVISGLFVFIFKGQMRWLAIAPLFISVLLYKPPPQEVVLLSYTAKSFALIMPREHMMYVSSRRYDRFAQDIWARRYGVAGENVKNIRSLDTTRCDEFACRMILPSGRSLSYLYHSAVAANECEQVDIVLSAGPVYGRCGARYSFDFFYVWRHGTVQITENGFSTVGSARGKRLWTVTNKR